MDFTDKKIAIVGYGVEGQATAHYLKAHGASVSVRDANADLKSSDEYDTRFGSNYLEGLEGFDLIFRSPSIHPELLADFSNVTTSTQFFLEHSPAPVIGVTGTKGKGTTSTLLTQLINVIEQKAWLGGNIGTPKLSFLDKMHESDVAVLELSSFQLIDCTVSPQIAVCLMIEPDHLNWHPDMEEYITAKANITTHQKDIDVFVHHPTNQNVQAIVSLSPAQKRAYMKPPTAWIENSQIIFAGEKLMPVSNVGMIGVHNLENICAALTALEAFAELRGISLSFFRQSIADCIGNFKGLEHRLEFVREIDGIQYFNDSYSVMPAATTAGIRSFTKPVICIVGGVDKKVSYSQLAESLTFCKHVVLIGEIAPTIKKYFNENNYHQFTIVDGGMATIVEQAQKRADSGDVVLLSPGTSSYDMFKSYKDRGEQFKKVINSL